MRRIVMSGVLAGVLALAVSAGAETPAEKGAAVFGSQKCSMCHSVAGKGNPKGVLDGVGGKLKAEEIRQWILDAPAMAAKTGAVRKPAMKSYASLAKDDVEGLVAYLSTLKK